MAVNTIPMPQTELVRVADANAAVAGVSRNLFELSKEIKDPNLAQRLQQEISKLLDSNEQISDAVMAAGALKR